MKKLTIYEPAMCCTTGVCGPSVDPELLRISLIIKQIKANGGQIDRFNLTDNPMAFVNDKVINDLLNSEGMEGLPVTILDGEIVKKGGYLSDEEMLDYLDIEIKKPVFIMNDIDTGGSNGCC